MAGPIAGPPEPPRPLARDRGGDAPAARQAFWLVPSSDSKPESGPGSVAGAETRMKTSRPRHAATELGLGLGHRCGKSWHSGRHADGHCGKAAAPAFT